MDSLQKSKCKTNVVGALFGDAKGLFYSFSRKEEWLQINPQMYEFVGKHKLAIEKLNYYEWAKVNGYDNIWQPKKVIEV